ncbi:MAG: DNA-processing protein DprA [Bacteroidia bacterium]|jgi:DNA processing protein|nr:DNA-processing protein DprA [Bacteroidia bacterium]GIV23455.1 MAG: DNA processing protein DprA [Bacteroidia bacterium]
MSEELVALVALTQVEGIGGKHIRLLRQRLSSLAALWEEKPRPGLPARLQEALARRSTLRKTAETLIEKAQLLGIRLIPYWEADFPRLLHEIPQPPALLYQKGPLSLNALPLVAVVGTRKPSPYGLKATTYFVEALVEAGVGIVSGLAYGIDARAHQVTIEKGGKTVAVLAHGLDKIYPATHRRLAEAILAEGAWISEYPPGAPLHPLQFPFRNRLIAGLAHLTLVIESREKGGALHTAHAAFVANRPVFAVPGEIFTPSAQGCYQLIVQQVAQLAYSPAQLLEELRLQTATLPLSPTPIHPTGPTDPLHAQIYAFLGEGPKAVDEIIARTGLSAAEIAQHLLLMEIEGWITQRGGNLVLRTTPPNATS